MAELANIADRIAENTAVFLAAHSKGQQRAPEPRPRPDTAVERVRHRLRETQHNRLTRRLLPHKYSDPG